ncbi:MAG: pectate lyase [Phycisphaeraceae bacterium]|nr:pectate lyase [Phycisphaeraceae bacterium]
MRWHVLTILLAAAAATAPERAWAGSLNWKQILKKEDDWFKSDAGRKALANILSHQTAAGAWPKNIDTTARPHEDSGRKRTGTFDNGATVGEMRLLSRAYRATGRKPYLRALNRAIDHVLEAQYPNGGWPQRHPPPKQGYPRHITFNDDAMVNLMHMVRDLSESKDFVFVDQPRRDAAKKAFDRGIRCILAAQIRVDGRRTAWCAQHDEQTLEPRQGRAYEHPSISGSESVPIVRLLMGLDRPSAEVIAAVEAACRYLDRVRIEGIRIQKENGDKKVVPDPDAEDLWTRFYQIKTNRPIFSGRDGVIRYKLSDIEPERRNGYGWYTTRPARLLNRDWPAWRKRIGKK